MDGNELGHLYYRESGYKDIFENFQGWKYWADTIYPGSAPFAYNFNFLTGRQEVNSIYVDYIDVWAVRDGDVVPIPPALWLFGSGLLGLVGMARRSKNNFVR